MGVRLTGLMGAASALVIAALAPAASAQTPPLTPPGNAPVIGFDVHEGTSMSVSASPDGRMLIVDLQGSLWLIPAKGGAAKRIGDYFSESQYRQSKSPPISPFSS